MKKYVRNDKLVSLLMNPVKQLKYPDISDDNINMFKPVLFELFVKVREVVLVTTPTFGDDMYNFNLNRFLEDVLCSTLVPKSLKRIIIEDGRKKWLEAAFSDSKMKQSFVDQGWKTDLKDRMKLVCERLLL